MADCAVQTWQAWQADCAAGAPVGGMESEPCCQGRGPLCPQLVYTCKAANHYYQAAASFAYIRDPHLFNSHPQQMHLSTETAINIFEIGIEWQFSQMI